LTTPKDKEEAVMEFRARLRRKREQNIKEWQEVLEETPKGSMLQERIRLAIAIEELKRDIEEPLYPLPLGLVILLSKMINFFKRA